jgi:hypothetical protein
MPTRTGSLELAASGTRELEWRVWAAAWGGVVVAAFVNGALHRVYSTALPELTATQLSEVVLPLLVAPWALRVEGHHPLPNALSAAAVGAGWAVATVTFEFLFGHYFNGDTWESLRGAYNLGDGRLWSLDVAGIAAAPAMARAWRQRHTGEKVRTP